VNQEIPSCGFCGLYQSAGEKPVARLESDEHGGERVLGVAEEGEFGQTALLKRLNTAQN
jgi:hypothetical protein